MADIFGSGPGGTHECQEDIEKVRRLAFREGREAGAKDMRDRIAVYLQKQGIEYSSLPMTVGERLEFEHNWDARVRKDN